MKFEDAKKEAKVSKIPKNVNIKNISEPKIDTLTYSKAVTTNNKLARSLEVNQALAFGKYFTFMNSALKPTPEEKSANFDNLLFTNKKILRVLERIERNMIDEQDTSIKHNSKDSKNIYLTEKGYKSGTQKDSDGSDSDLGLNIAGNRLGNKGKKGNKPKNNSKSKKELKKSSKENVSKEKTSKEKTSKEELKKSSKENVSKENVSKENVSKEELKKSSKENVSKDKTSKEKTSKEKTSKEELKKSSKENVSKDKTSKEKTSKEELKKSSKENVSKENVSKEELKKSSKENVSKEKPSKPIKEVKASKNKVKPEKDTSKPLKETEASKNKVKPEKDAKKSFKDMTAEEKRTAAEKRLRRMKYNHFKRNFIPSSVKILSRGASIIGTGIIIADGVYQYVNAECAGDRQDAVASTIGAAGGAIAGAKIGAAIGVVGGPIGMAAGALIGAGLGALAGSALGEWISGKFKTPLDLIPDKFKNRGPKVEYAYIQTVLMPRMNQLTYSSEEEYNKDFAIVEKRMIELVEEMKKGSTDEEEREWDKNKLINDDIVTDNWFSKNSIKDWKKVESLSDRDFDILINDADLNELDKDRVREIRFRKEAANKDEASSAVSALDRINQALEAERKRSEEIRKTQNTYNVRGYEVKSAEYRRSLKTIEELQEVKKTMLGHAEKGDYKAVELDEKVEEINKTTGKQFDSLTIANTSTAESFAEYGQTSKEYAEAWATTTSKSKDISRDAIADFTSIKAENIEFNKNDHLGFISGEFESGGNPGTIAKDNIGYAYGAWQMNSRVGLLKPFLETLKGDSRFENLTNFTVDSPEFQAEWAKVAKEHPSEFLEKQHQFIEDVKFKPVLNFARSHGLNTTNRAVQEALWSQAVQHGEKGNRIIILNAIKKIGNSNNPQDIVRALYESRTEYINGLSTLDDSLKAQINKRYQKESAKALGVIQNSEFQNSDITKNVNNSDITKNVNTETDESFKNDQTPQEKHDERVEEETLSKSDKSSNEGDLPVIEIEKVEKRESDMSIEDLNKNIVNEITIENEKPTENKVERHQSPDFADWSILAVN